MNFFFFASLLIFIWLIHHNIRKGAKKQEKQENAFWEYEFGANHVRKQSLEDLPYVSFQAEPFYPKTLLGSCQSADFLQKHPEAKEYISRLLFLEKEKIVNLNAYTNTDLKYKYGVANLPALTEYDSHYNELITLLQKYGELLQQEGYESQALSVLEYAVSIHSDISASYLLCAEIYRKTDRRDALTQLKQKAEALSSPRSSAIVRKLQEFDPYTD